MARLRSIFAALALAGLALGCARTQQPEADYHTKVRRAAPSGVALEFLVLEERSRLFELVRKGRTTVRLGSETVTRENVEDLAGRLDRQRAVVAEEMIRRGFVNVAGDYDLRKSGATAKIECRQLSDELRVVAVTQNKEEVEFKDPSGKVIGGGVVVDSSLAIKLGGRGGMSPYFLLASLTGEQLALTFMDSSRVGFGEPVSTCELGLLVRRAGKAS